MQPGYIYSCHLSTVLLYFCISCCWVVLASATSFAHISLIITWHKLHWLVMSNVFNGCSWYLCMWKKNTACSWILQLLYNVVYQFWFALTHMGVVIKIFLFVDVSQLSTNSKGKLCLCTKVSVNWCCCSTAPYRND